MCTGAEAIAIAGAVASAAGTAATTASANNERDAQIKASNNATQRFLSNNQKIANESTDIFNQRLAQEENTSAAEEISQLSERRQQATTPQIDANAVLAPLRGSAPKVVSDEAARSVGEANDRSKDQAENLANLRSFSDLVFSKNLSTQDTARQLSTLNGFSNTNAALLPSQQELAVLGASGGNGLGALGTIGTIGGSLATSGAGAGQFDGLFGSSTAPTTSPIPVPRRRT